MSQCDFCDVCRPKRCPKEGKLKPESVMHINLSVTTAKKLEKLCKDKNIMRGEKYYKVPDYDKAVLYLLKKYLIVIAILFFGIIGTNIYGGLFAMDNKIVVLETNQGAIEIELMPEVAPKACENFIKLIEKEYYNGIIFHRVIKGFMIQGGDPTGTGSGGESIWGRSFEDEFDENVQFDSPGILAMANAGPNTNGSQFFIATAKTPWLNMCHTIFGKVISGYDVVEKIENTSVGPSDKPAVEQKIIKAYLKS